METLLLIALICIAVLAVLFFLKPRPVRGTSPRARPALAPGERDWETRVLAQMMGDRARLERTVQSRRAKHPAASRAELLEIIHQEYVRDRS